MKEVFIISTGQIVKGKTAGSQRVMNVAKSLAYGDANVFLCAFPQIESDNVESISLSPGISYLKSSGKKVSSLSHLVIFLRAVQIFIKNRNSECVIFLYPTAFILKDFIYLFYFKVIKGYKFYCDINELRATKVFLSSPPKKILSRVYYYLKSFYNYTVYKLNEIQVPFYDGIVVISTNLEKYFTRRAKKIMRIPILCDITKVKETEHQIKFDEKIFRICFAGFIDCEKEGFDILFEALYQINLKKNVELYLYGDFPEEEQKKLKQLTDAFTLKERVFYKGHIEPDMLLEEFTKYHLLILPRPLTAQTKYGFSTKLSEYLISGVPVLVTDVSDNALYIRNNYNGFIISPGSMTEMVKEILEIIENYNNNSSIIVKNAIKTAREELDYKLFTASFINFLFYS